MPQGLAPLKGKNAKILILGSFPGPISLQVCQYYAHPNNSFWRIMSAIYELDLDAKYRRKAEVLKDNGIALWDVVEFCERVGSLDKNIQNPISNDFRSFLIQNRKITKILLNGRKAEKLFRTLVCSVEELRELQLTYVPSTSPANTRTNFESKLQIWQAALV